MGGDKEMLKYVASFAAAILLVLTVPARPLVPSGSWEVDARHSDARISTDGTTDFGKTKINVTVGFTRVNGEVKLDSADLSNSKFDFRMYPASSMAPPIDEEGKVRIEWFANHANSTLVCFHSKGAQQTSDGRLKTTGTLILTRVDRNVEITPGEAYAGPVYGAAIIHRIPHEATFVFDFPLPTEDPEPLAAGSTRVASEDFPQVVKSVIATYWPPVIQDKNCDMPVSVGEGYSGSQCTGTFLQAKPLPQQGRTTVGEDYPGPAGFNSITGGHLDFFVRLRLKPGGSSPASGGN
jgi:polyisoprenoid-binding protein YceI